MEQYLIGVDNGGTVIKAAIFDTQGHELAVASRQTPLLTPRPGYTERDMEGLWQSNAACIRDAVAKSGLDPARIVGLAVSGHGKGLYAWGKDGKPAAAGIVSTDNRAWRIAERWREDGTAEALYPQLCQKLIPSQQAALMAWMKANEPAAYDSIRWVFSVKDYIRFRLTGEAYCEATDISGSGLLDVKNARFDRDLLARLGIPEVYDKLAPLRYSSDACGVVTPEAALSTGLRPGTPVAGGMFDIDACAIAMAITAPEQLCTITGTWSINEFISPQPILGTDIAMNSLYAIPGYYLLEECSPTSAGNLEWFIRENMKDQAPPPGKSRYQHIDDLVAGVDPGSSDVYYLPFLYGSNAHPLARASFVGLTSYHTQAHLLRALYEGVAYSHRTHIDKLLSVRPAPRAIRMAGGAANSPVWVQMFADVLGLPVETVQGVTELGALGAAMAATVSSGIYADYGQAARAMVRVNPPLPPDAGRSAVYAEKYRKYTAIRDGMDKIWDMFAV